MVPHEERMDYYIRSLGAESSVFPLTGRQATGAHFVDFASFKLDNNNKLKSHIAHAS